MTVARATGQSLADAFAAPYALTLWTYAVLRDLDELDDLQAGRDRLDLAGLVARAFHEPASLTKKERDFDRMAEALDAPTTRQAILARALENHRRIVASGPLQPSPPDHGAGIG